ncbi:MAG: archaeosortase/exosortase family protein [candidate division NC10 bacterium]|nr:archaeosortase/exosortase family protein [candidate division NC10 bacterium]MDE2485604.1 archaeosortase/exosortase family protein [candidate division NC10 bacterium]
MSPRQPHALLPRQEGLSFCLRFALYTVASFLLLYALHKPVVVPFTRAIAYLAYVLLTILGAHAWISGASVGIPGFAVEIKNNCNAIYEIGLYGAAIFAYPAPMRGRLTGFLLGGVVLYVVNLLRVVSLLALGRYWPGGFQAAHLYVWQALFLALVAACWFGWLSRVRSVA